jgi:hypothetical protein
MDDEARRLLEEALHLPTEQIPREVEQAWAEEIERRALDMEAGVPHVGGWKSVCDALEAELQQRRRAVLSTEL